MTIAAGRAAHPARLHGHRAAVECAGEAEQVSLAVDLARLREERLGDVLRAQRVAGEKAGFRVVAWLRSEMDRHARHTVTPMLKRSLVFEPRLEEVLDFCAEEPVERVYLEDVARRGLGRFVATEADGKLEALCHVGANVVPSGAGCAVFARAARSGRARMIIGEERAVGELWERPGGGSVRRASTVPGSPSTCSTSHRRPAAPACARPRPPISTSSSLPARRLTRTRWDRPARRRPGRLSLAHARPDRGRALLAVGGERHDPLQGRGIGLDA